MIHNISRVSGPLLLSTLLITGGGRAGRPQTNPFPPAGGVAVGKPLFVSSATVVCGPLETEYPFAPETYGKVRGYSPTTSPDAKIVLYTRVLDKRFFRLAVAVDALVAQEKSLAASSLVIVIDDKGAQRGSYSLEEVKQRREAIRLLAKKNKISHLSFFLSAPGAESIAPNLRLTDANLLLAHLVGSDPPGQHAIVQWFTQQQTTRMDDDTLAATMTALKKSVAGK